MHLTTINEYLDGKICRSVIMQIRRYVDVLYPRGWVSTKEISYQIGRLTCTATFIPQITPGLANLASKVGQIGPNGTNLGLFKISFSTFWLGEPN